MKAALPTVVIGGYLGAGKTTLVNHLLRHAEGLRIAVLVNDFGDLDIDADLIEGQDGLVLSLAGGCICCSFGADLVGTLQAITQGSSPPEMILIESSGVALPGAVERSAGLVTGLQLLGVMVLLDAETSRERAHDRFVGETVMRQIHDADLLVLNKGDLVSATDLASTRAWLNGLVPDTPVVETLFGELPAGFLHDLAAADGDIARDAPRPHRAAPRPGVGAQAKDTHESSSWTELRPLDVEALANELARHKGIVRAKGFLNDISGGPCVLQMVGRRRNLTFERARATDVECGRLVVIALRGQMPRSLHFLQGKQPADRTGHA
jgi:G3E family GTPase